MSKFVTVTEAGEQALEKLKGQSKELLAYLIKKYGVGKPINQSELVLDLNSHQFDTEVLSKKSTSPISRLYEFYRSKIWVKEKWVIVTSDTTAKAGAPSKKYKKLEESFQALVAHLKALEDILEANSIEYPASPLADDEDDDTAEEANSAEL